MMRIGVGVGIFLVLGAAMLTWCVAAVVAVIAGGGHLDGPSGRSKCRCVRVDPVVSVPGRVSEMR